MNKGYIQNGISFSIESKVLDAVRIPSIVLVVLIHITGYGMRQVNICPDDYSLYMSVNGKKESGFFVSTFSFINAIRSSIF